LFDDDGASDDGVKVVDFFFEVHWTKVSELAPIFMANESNY
jgi:hypothetical protein